ncbi:MAG: TIGR01244 family sulfur transferase [Solimonas sp.]
MAHVRWRAGPGAAFALAVVVGAAVVLAIAAYSACRREADRVPVASLTREVWVSEQITPDRLAHLRDQGFRSIIDLRPDGEAPDQMPSADVKRMASENGLGFAYVPVEHGEIASTTVDALATSLRSVDRPVLLYCRSGRRAARTWALAEASRPGGLDAAAIDAALHAAGHSATDLGGEISSRIAARAAP